LALLPLQVEPSAARKAVVADGKTGRHISSSGSKDAGPAAGKKGKSLLPMRKLEMEIGQAIEAAREAGYCLEKVLQPDASAGRIPRAEILNSRE
jgi:hypothetical protein